MASTNSTVDGMGFEESNQEVTSTEVISGTNVYATTSVTTPTVTATDVNTTNVNATDVIATTSTSTNVSGTTSVRGADVYTTEGELQSVSIGSGTAVYGAIIQAGSGVLTSNDAWITFPNAYAGIPSPLVSNRSDVDAGLHISAGSLNAGSFHVIGTNASDKFSWMAVGI